MPGPERVCRVKLGLQQVLDHAFEVTAIVDGMKLDPRAAQRATERRKLLRGMQRH